MSSDDILKLTALLIGPIAAIARSLLTLWLNSRLRVSESKSALLHDRQVEVIAELYKLLFHLRTTAAPLLAVQATDIDVRKQDAGKCYANFKTYFGEHRLFLDKQLCEAIDKLLSKVDEGHVRLAVHDLTNASPVEKLKWWRNIPRSLSRTFP